MNSRFILFFKNWNFYVKEKHKYDVLFLKYEFLNKKDNQDKMFNFINPDIDNIDYINWNPKEKPMTYIVSEQFIEEYDKLPEVFLNYYEL